MGIFCHYEDEYAYLTKIREELTDSSGNLNQKYFRLHEPIVIPAVGDMPETVYTYLYIRRPDQYRAQVGDVDFVLGDQDYAELKKALQSGAQMNGARVFDRPDLDMVELSDPDSDALAYVSTVAMTEKVRVKQQANDSVKKENIKVNVVAGVVIKKDGKYLLIQEKKSSAYGLWNLPAGRVDVGESLEQAAIREAKEESGYDVELIRELAVFHEESTDVVKHAFEAKIVGGALKFPVDEILDAKWFTFDEVHQMQEKLRGNWIVEAMNMIEKEASE